MALTTPLILHHQSKKRHSQCEGSFLTNPGLPTDEPNKYSLLIDWQQIQRLGTPVSRTATKFASFQAEIKDELRNNSLKLHICHSLSPPNNCTFLPPFFAGASLAKKPSSRVYKLLISFFSSLVFWVEKKKFLSFGFYCPGNDIEWHGPEFTNVVRLLQFDPKKHRKIAPAVTSRYRLELMNGSPGSWQL